jgi:hypothetical protein
MLRLLPLVALFAGCSLVRTPLIDPPDTAGIDAGVDAPIVERDVPEGFDGGVDAGIDAGMRDTGGMDTGMPDTGMPDTGVDAGMPDTGVDAGMPDTGVDAPPARPTCDELFAFLGGAYEACANSDTTCEFVVDRPGMNEMCSAICGMAPGSTCSGAFRTSGTCTREETETCGSSGSDRICICTRP